MGVTRIIRRTVLGTSLIGCSAVGGPATDMPSRIAREATNLWHGRTVLLYVDVSASVDPAFVREPIERVARELTAGDRLVVLSLGDRADERPLLDSTLTGSAADRLSRQLGLSTRESRANTARLAGRLAAGVSEAVLRSRSRRRPRYASPARDAVCGAADQARALPSEQVVAILVTDGLEDSRWTAHHALALTDKGATSFARMVRSDRPCSLAESNLTIRLVGVRHPTDTPGLIAWWTRVLRTLGYPTRSGDVATYLLGPIVESSPAVPGVA